MGEGKALEMNLRGDAIGAYEALRFGLVNQVVPDHELFDTALSWARKMAQQAPIAIEKIKQVSHQGELGEGLEVEGKAFGEAFGSEDAKEGIGAFLGKRQAELPGQVVAGPAAARSHGRRSGSRSCSARPSARSS